MFRVLQLFHGFWGCKFFVGEGFQVYGSGFWVDLRGLGVIRVEVWSLIQDIYVGGCQSYGPFLGTRNIRCRAI